MHPRTHVIRADDGHRVSLAELRRHLELANMRVLARGNRLSITSVSPAAWKFITTRLMA
ncbi:MAG TPA: EVE domain-containing protein [Rhodocyclaceae bacterium]|nr:EVE domain-containing protein [Rhodocyclaceae bacterium]